MSTLFAALSASASALDAQRTRMEVAVSNLANADSTRGADGLPYRRRGVVLQDVEGLPVRRDGNNVQLDRELLNMSRATGDFAAAQTALAAKFRLVRYAINEGR